MKKFLMAVLIVILAGGLAFLLLRGRLGQEPLNLPEWSGLLGDSGAGDAKAAEAAEAFLGALNGGDPAGAEALLAKDAQMPEPYAPATENGRVLRELIAARPQFAPAGELLRSGSEARLSVTLYAPDPEALTQALTQALQARLDARMESAARTGEVLTRDYDVRPEILAQLGGEAFADLAAEPLADTERGSYEITLRKEGRAWRVSDCAALLSAAWGADTDALAEKLLSEAAEGLHTQPKHYTLPVDARQGQTPDPEGFGETDDPAVIEELLARPEAQRLLEGKELIWSADIERFPNSTIHYYLDETILAIVWQEVTAWAQGTYAEIIVADGSQLCRKLSEDTFNTEKNHLPTVFAQQTQAVVTLGGDFYRYPGRYNGICVYEGEIYRFEPDSSDCCFVTDQGEFLFVYRGQFATREEAQAYIDENHVRFSLCFGPVVIENGENVTPQFYRWGEIYDRYARAILGCKEDKHYLACTVNAKTPGYFNLVTLADATQSMLAHGCQRAYVLDGGQTATIVLGGEVINTVQFGVERAMSDVIFFGSALPPEVEP